MDNILDGNGMENLAMRIASELVRFPAYADAKTLDMPPSALFQLVVDAYENDNLTEEQELIFESLLYLHNLAEDFDLRRALAILSTEDFLQFQTTLADSRTLQS